MGIKVIGAGMAGLLAAAMLRKECDAVYEAASELPNNHSAVLRFRSSVVADTLNIPFKEVKAIKAAEAWRNPIADAMAYSRKTNGTATLRSVLTTSDEPRTRYIAPQDLIWQMYSSVDAPVVFGHQWGKPENKDSGPWISTMPMPSLMKLLGWQPQSDFRWRSGNNFLVQLEGVDAYCSLYVPDPTFPAARISITGDQMIAECYGGPWKPRDEFKFAEQCAEKVGLHPSQLGAIEERQQTYAKILPIDEQERRAFILWASQEFGIYSLGRFATWRPGLLMDDVVNDVRVIQRLISNRGESYAHYLKG